MLDSCAVLRYNNGEGYEIGGICHRSVRTRSWSGRGRVKHGRVQRGLALTVLCSRISSDLAPALVSIALAPLTLRLRLTAALVHRTTGNEHDDFLVACPQGVLASGASRKT